MISTKLENEFQINEYITLKFEDGRTKVYVDGELVRYCKYLLLQIPVENIPQYDEINSIDEISDYLDNSLEYDENMISIDPKVEFWGHCSNLQVWAENQYDTRLLHSNLAFPLLKKLTKAGDNIARRVFKEEIALRFEEGNFNTLNFLLLQNYLKFLTSEERNVVYSRFKLKMKSFVDCCLQKKIYYALPFLALIQFGLPKSLRRYIERNAGRFFNKCNILEIYTILINMQKTFTPLVYSNLIRDKKEFLMAKILSNLNDIVLNARRFGYKELQACYEICYELIVHNLPVHVLFITQEVFKGKINEFYEKSNCKYYFERDNSQIGFLQRYKVTLPDTKWYYDYSLLSYSSLIDNGDLYELSKILFPRKNVLITNIIWPKEEGQSYNVNIIDLSEIILPNQILALFIKLFKIYNTSYPREKRIVQQLQEEISRLKKDSEKLCILFFFFGIMFRRCFSLRFISPKDFKKQLHIYLTKKGCQYYDYCIEELGFCGFRIGYKDKDYDLLDQQLGQKLPLTIDIIINDLFFSDKHYIFYHITKLENLILLVGEVFNSKEKRG